METKRIMIRTVGLLFLSALFMTAFGHDGTLQEIPGDKVYTELQKTLINGTWGKLTCRFTGPPYAVYWKKGHDPFTAPNLMTWTPDGRTGPRYEDGTCDMDENYSLIIKAVDNTDAGRYICLVSNQHGVLIDNYTDVTVTDIALKTKPTVSIRMGQTGVLPCQVNIHPKKVSWIRSPDTALITIDLVRNVIERSGPGYEDGLFNMTKEYSLVIKDVTIQHEGRYLCEVIYLDTDNVYQDITMLSVFTEPTAPFPVIEGCFLEDKTNCIITTGSSITLTCHVNEYYPDIDLFFIHGSKRVEPIDTKTWNNTDGTKNTSITISADKSKDTYKCIASRIPGLDPNDEDSASVRLIQEQRISLILTVLFVPIVICLTGVLLTWMKLRRRGKRLSKEEKYMEDHISFAELWQLAEFITELERDKLVSLIKSLNGNEELPTNMNQDYYYQELCRWKDANAQTVKQRTALHGKFSKAGVDELLKNLEGFRKDILAEVPIYDLEHILWQIPGPQEIADFLKNLGVKLPSEMQLPEKKSFIQDAVGQLVSWTKGTLAFNPVVVLSSTLEQMGMCTADNNFFKLPAKKKEDIRDKDVRRLMRDITKNHCCKLERIMETSRASVEFMPTALAIDDNKVLFDTEKMLRDWWKDAACSNYDKRRKLKNVCQEVCKDIESAANGPWISDEELKIISRCLNPTSMASVCKKLSIIPVQEDSDEKGRFETLRVWRESVTESEWVSMYRHLRNALGEVRILGLLAPLKDKPIHKAEYVDIAFELLMTDVVPLARALGINKNKLPAYRPVFEPTHLKEGTIGLVAHLMESTKKDSARLELCFRLREAGFPLAISRNILVQRMAYGELYAISEEMKKCYYEQKENESNNDEEKSPGEGDSLLHKDNTSMKMETSVEKLQEGEAMTERYLIEIKKMLKLGLAECPIPKMCHDEFALFKIWKERPLLAVFNERAAIIQQLFDMQRDDIARSVAEGNYCKTEISLPFVQSIVKKMNKDEILRLAEVFSLKKEVEDAKDKDDFGHVASGIIHGSIRKHKSTVMTNPKANEERALMDNLLQNGFLGIALELIVI